LAELAANYNNNFAALIASKRFGGQQLQLQLRAEWIPQLFWPPSGSEGSRQSSSASTPWLKLKMEVEMEMEFKMEMESLALVLVLVLAWPGRDGTTDPWLG